MLAKWKDKGKGREGQYGVDEGGQAMGSLY
jgi:hypothetical protein